MPRRSNTQESARNALLRNLTYLMRETWIPTTIAEEIPEAWHTLMLDLDCCEEKEKVTLYLDRSVVRFFRAMGQGYQARINRLLATYLQMHLAREINLDAALAAQAKLDAEKKAAQKAGESAVGAPEPGAGAERGQDR